MYKQLVQERGLNENSERFKEQIKGVLLRDLSFRMEEEEVVKFELIPSPACHVMLDKVRASIIVCTQGFINSERELYEALSAMVDANQGVAVLPSPESIKQNQAMRLACEALHNARAVRLEGFPKCTL